jgi:uroporphyrin-III C-methyltransferase/precorrin-2 dehydrogenase/sirohydrochlorin ferrochelatase
MTDSSTQPTGKIWLVGAGPGDPDLLTVKALRLIKTADVVIHDRLVSQAIMDLIPASTRRIYVGKARSDHAVPQEDINALLVAEAKLCANVLRLKGGDPFIFGRGGEELEEVAAAGIPFEVVPGITAASGCAAYAGIPLTHRDFAQSVRFITGHLKSDGMKNNGVNLHWPELMDPMQTLVFYMGLVGLQAICEQLIQHGRNPETPVALIEKGTTPEQRVIIATLATIGERVRAEKVSAPTLTIVGDVVSLHDKLKWR